MEPAPDEPAPDEPAPESTAPAPYEAHQLNTRTPWSLTIDGDTLRLASRTEPAQLEIERSRAPATLRLHHGYLLKNVITVSTPRRVMFRVDDRAFDAILAWLAPVSQSVLRRELVRRWIPVAMIALVSSQSSPLGWKLALPLVAPFVIARAIGLAAPHRLQFVISALAGAAIAGLEAFAIREASGWFHYVQLVVAATLVASELRARTLFARLPPEPTGPKAASLGRLVSIALLVVGIAATAVAAARHPFASGPAVTGPQELTFLGARATFPAGWRDAGQQQSLDPTDTASMRASLFFRGRTLSGASAYAQIFVVRGGAFDKTAFEENGLQIAEDLAKDYSSAMRKREGSIDSCEHIDLDGRRTPRCYGRVPTDDGELYLRTYLFTDTAKTTMAALVVLSKDALVGEEGHAIATTLEILPAAPSPAPAK